MSISYQFYAGEHDKIASCEPSVQEREDKRLMSLSVTSEQVFRD